MEVPSGLVRVASYRRKLPRKAKNIYLPTEVWVDVFCFPWITRKELAQMVDKIGNRWFGEQLQFYLHECGKHTLGHLHFLHQVLQFSKNIIKIEGIMNRCSNQFKLHEYPQTAMPENIKFYKSFQIGHFDNRVFNFFRRIQSLLTADTTLDIHHIREGGVENARTILGHLLPFIEGIHTISTNDRMLPIVKELLHEPIVKAFSPEKFP